MGKSCIVFGSEQVSVIWCVLRLSSGGGGLVAGKFENAGKLMTLLRHAESDAWLALGLSFHLNVLPLSRTLAEISGSLWSRALQVPYTNPSPNLPSFQLSMKQR